MAMVKPFQGVRYDTAKAGGDLGQLVCPPYDIIASARQKAFHEKHPKNFIQLDFGLTKDDDVPGQDDTYTRAAATWQEWLYKGILRTDDTPRYYLYRQTFAATVGGVDSRYVRTGIVASVHAEDFGGAIVPHEHTLAEPKEDRYRLTMATGAELGQVFFLYDDPEKIVETHSETVLAGPALARFLDDQSVEHSLYELTDPAALAAIESMFASQSLLIADGHHRYETSLRVWSELDPDGMAHRATLATLVNRCDPGLVVQPIHRIYRGLDTLTFAQLHEKLKVRFETEIFPWAGAEAAEGWLAMEAPTHHAFLVRWKNSPECLLVRAPRGTLGTFAGHTPEWSRLDLSILQTLVQEEILGIDPATYPAGTHVIPVVEGHLLADLLDHTPENQFFVMVNPTSVEEIEAVGRAGERMPQKSTFFHPKIWSGLVALNLRP
ncbi:MAG: hypothetical protein RL318_636 [Fibrobacterota bacterium]|jgi:uncharacterized protein (DUF1015 family)